MSNTHTQTITEAQAIFDKAQADVNSPYRIITKAEWTSMQTAGHYFADCIICGGLIKPGNARRVHGWKVDHKTQDEKVGYSYIHRGGCWLDYCHDHGNDGYGKDIPEGKEETYRELLAIVTAAYDKQYYDDLHKEQAQEAAA